MMGGLPASGKTMTAERLHAHAGGREGLDSTGRLPIAREEEVEGQKSEAPGSEPPVVESAEHFLTES